MEKIKEFLRFLLRYQSLIVIDLRPIESSDRENLRSWRNNPEISKYMYLDHYISKQEHNKWFDKIRHDETKKYWIIYFDGIKAGLVNLYDIDNINQRCSWAFYIANLNTRGKGVGSFVEYFVLDYVFNTLCLNKLICEVFEFNEAVIRMHKKFGFKEEGLFRNHIYKNNKPYNVHYLSILRDEWILIEQSIINRLKKVKII